MKLNNFSLSWPWFGFIAALLLIFLLLGGWMMFQINSSLAKKIAAAQEAKRPPVLSLTLIQDSACSDCYNLASLLQTIKSVGPEIKSETVLESDDPSAQQ